VNKDCHFTISANKDSYYYSTRTNQWLMNSAQDSDVHDANHSLLC